MGRSTSVRGFTLIEMIVVLVIISLAAALVAPSLLSVHKAGPALNSLIPAAREAAARREEMIYLRIATSGEWTMEGAVSPSAGALASGHIDPFPGLPLTLIVSPLGTCSFDVRSASAAHVIRLNPLTCTIDSA